MFNAMCPADSAASGSYALWQGNLCSGTEARFLITKIGNLCSGTEARFLITKIYTKILETCFFGAKGLGGIFLGGKAVGVGNFDDLMTLKRRNLRVGNTWKWMAVWRRFLCFLLGKFKGLLGKPIFRGRDTCFRGGYINLVKLARDLTRVPISPKWWWPRLFQENPGWWNRARIASWWRRAYRRWNIISFAQINPEMWLGVFLLQRFLDNENLNVYRGVVFSYVCGWPKRPNTKENTSH